MKKFEFESYTEWNGNGYETVTKVYAVIPKAAQDAIARAENWQGCHWDAPDVVYAESVEGTEMSAEALVLINALNAECIEEESEEE